MDPRLLKLAQTVWDYHKLNHQLEKADAILVLCSHDERVAERSAELFHDGWAPLVIFSGGSGAITKQLWSEPEAEVFARIAIERGVPSDKILIENRSSNTGENIRFTKQLLADRGLELQKFIIVQKPYMERRSYATFKKLWPDKDVVVTSPQISFAEYLHSYSNTALSSADVVSIMVGDLQRIRIYPARGFQIEQDVPVETLDAYNQLVAAGFTKHLINPEPSTTSP
jgi:uncharacterized SAM-binding protein YcdF (DUF218 family)